MSDTDGDRHDYYRALANCEITFFDNQDDDANFEDVTTLANFPRQPIPVSFGRAARGCASRTMLFDESRQKNVMEMESTLAVFHGEDNRPGIVRGLTSLMGITEPRNVPRYLRSIAAPLLERFGPGEVMVAQDLTKTVIGEVAAREEGREAPFFPADSWFDQYLLVNAMGRTYTNRQKLRVSSVVDVWPPQGQTYKSEGVTPFYPTDEEDYDGPPAFLFGNCTINIVEAIDDEALGEFQELQAGIQPN